MLRNGFNRAPFLGHLFCHAGHRFFCFALATQEPDHHYCDQTKEGGHPHGPAPGTATQLGQIVAKLEHACLESFAASKRMEKMRIRFQHIAIGALQLRSLGWFRLMRVDRKTFVDKQVPDLLTLFARVERLVLSIAYPAEFGVWNRRFIPITLTN